MARNVVDGDNKAGSTASVRRSDKGWRIVDDNTGRLVTTRKGEPIDTGGMTRKRDARLVAEKISESHARLGTKNHTITRK